MHNEGMDKEQRFESVERITFEVTQREAMALAQFEKRVTFESVRTHAVSDDEAYVMLDAMANLMKGLNEAGYDPR
jgi:phage baseplate assembly protein W